MIPIYIGKGDVCSCARVKPSRRLKPSFNLAEVKKVSFAYFVPTTTS